MDVKRFADPYLKKVKSIIDDTKVTEIPTYLKKVESIMVDTQVSDFNEWTNKEDFDKLHSVHNALMLLTRFLENYNRKLIELNKLYSGTFNVSYTTSLINSVKRRYNELENRVTDIKEGKIPEIDKSSGIIESLQTIEQFMKTYQPEIAKFDPEKKSPVEVTESVKSLSLEQVETTISHVTTNAFHEWKDKGDRDKLISLQTAFILLSFDLDRYNENLDCIQQRNPNSGTFKVSSSKALINNVKKEYNALENRIKLIRLTEIDTRNDKPLEAIETFMKAYQPEITALEMASLEKEKKANHLTMPSKPCMAATIVVVSLVSAIALNQFFGI